MSIALVFIILAIAIIIGPVMMMRPSKYQQKIAKLRIRAAKKGIQVRISPNTFKSEYPRVAIYTIRWSDEVMDYFKRHPSWRLSKKKYSHELHFDKEWDWDSQDRAEEVFQEILKKSLKKSPVDIIALEASSLGLSCYWDENCESSQIDVVVDNLATWLVSTMENLGKVIRH